MFKLLGSISVILAAGIIGIKKYTQLYERRRILCAVRDGAERIRDNIRCKCMPLYDCFLCGGEFFERASFYMTDGLLPSAAVKCATEEVSFFIDRDRDSLQRFSDGLCSEDCEGQLRNVELLIAETGRNIEHAESQLETRGRLFIKGSFLIAAAVVLVLI